MDYYWLSRKCLSGVLITPLFKPKGMRTECTILVLSFRKLLMANVSSQLVISLGGVGVTTIRILRFELIPWEVPGMVETLPRSRNPFASCPTDMCHIDASCHFLALQDKPESA